MAGGGNAPEAPQMSQEEKDLYKKQSELLDRINKTYGTSLDTSTQNADILKQVSGLFKADPGGTITLNQDALNKQIDLNKLSMDRYERALRGTLPVSEGLTQQKSDDFKLLKENAARRGIGISGDTPETATSDSTAGAALLGQFNKTYGLRTDAERQAQLAGNNNTSLSLLGASQETGPASLLGVGGNISNSYANAASPYANQRQLEYQAALGQYGYNQQSKGNVIGAGLAGAGTGAAVGGPWGAAIGGAVGVGAGLLGQ